MKKEKELYHIQFYGFKFYFLMFSNNFYLLSKTYFLFHFVFKLKTKNRKQRLNNIINF